MESDAEKRYEDLIAYLERAVVFFDSLAKEYAGPEGTFDSGLSAGISAAQGFIQDLLDAEASR